MASATRVRSSRARYRFYSNEVQRGQPLPPRQSTARDDSAHHYYSESLHHALTTVGRFFKFAAIGGVGLGLAVTAAWEGAHQWVEYHELAPIPQNLPDPFEWGRELERWTAPLGKGGTDPRLGLKGRHFVRAAWISLNWAHGSDASIIQATRSGADSAAFNDNSLVTAVVYLDSALSIALRKPEIARGDGTMDRTVVDLNTLRASVLARIGSLDALKSASSIYLQVHDALLREGKNSDAARMAVKLGDISARLNETDAAIGWWKAAIELVGRASEPLYSQSDKTGEPKPVIDTSPLMDTLSSASTYLPQSAYSQRTLMSALVPLSAHYATSRKLQEALAIESAMFAITLKLLPQTPPSSSPSPSRIDESGALHDSFLFHRDALLRIHAAEVLYAFRNVPSSSHASSVPKSPSFFQGLFRKLAYSSASPFEPDSIPACLALLKYAISSTEYVINSLTQEPISPPKSDLPLPPPDPFAPLNSDLASSPLLRAPSEVLLRQAKRTASHAYNLTGLVLEEQGDKEQALEHFERALEWAGGREGHDERNAIQSEWKSVWVNYVRVREAVLNQGLGEKKE